MRRRIVGLAVAIFMPAALASAAESGAGKKPLCWVQITPRSGLPSEAYLLSFENGTFTLRHKNKQEYTVAEKDVQAIRFMPAERATKAPKRPRAVEAEGADVAPKSPLRRPFGEARAKLDDKLLRRHEPRFRELKRTGRLGSHIKDLEGKLRDSKDVFVARQIMFELFAAHRVNGRMPEREYWRRLVESIRDPLLRRSPQLRGIPMYGGRPYRR